MSLLDKFKDLFTDEEEYEVEEEIPIKEKKEKEHTLPTFMREKIEREKDENIENTNDLVKQIPQKEKKKEKVDLINTEDDIVKEDNNNNNNNNFKFPIAFEEKDFVETTRQSKQNVIYQEHEKKKVEENKKKSTAEIYGSKKEKKDVPKFKASPIISPVYGILDKNYKKEEVKVNNGDVLKDYEAKTIKGEVKVDFESVRKKAFGSLTDEIRDNLNCEDCEYYQEAKRKQSENKNEKFFGEPDNEDVSIGEAVENYYDFGVSYEPVHKYEETDDVKIVNHEDNVGESEQIEIKEPVKAKPNVLSTLKKSMGDEEAPTREKKSIEDLELTDDLFNLIDSMYDERNDD